LPTVLFFRPDTDQAMTYAKYWVGIPIQKAIDLGYTVLDMVDSDATKEKLEELMKNEKIDLAFMAGHGNSNTFTGYQQEIVMQACQNDQIMSGTISHFLSCSVGQQLLPSMISKTAISTIGYQVDFQFMIDTSVPIEQDQFAEPFKDVTVAIINSILDGKPLKEVWDTGIAKCEEWIAKLWNKTETDWAEVISCLEHNRDGMIALGDKEAYVLPPRRAGLNIPGLTIVGLALLTLSGGKLG
jgi:hypothetical protein